MPIQMELRRIIISELDEQQVIVLKEVDGDRSFPIVIGLFEASSIDRRVRGLVAPGRSPTTSSPTWSSRWAGRCRTSSSAT
ncbi:MAG: hypothetical protein U0871_28810 [Gemmataceae bacterium]